MSTKIQQYKRLKQSAQAVTNETQDADPHKVNEMLARSPMSVPTYAECVDDFRPTNREVENEVAALRREIDQARMSSILDEMKDEAIKSLAGPFGIGKFVALGDRNGGNVDTVHNARNGVWATEKARKDYEQRGPYDADRVHRHADYKKENKRQSINRKSVGVEDAYTGKTLDYTDDMDLDHIISAKEVHDDPGRTLAGRRTEDVANKSENLAPTDPSVNRAKRDMSAGDYAQRVEDNTPERKAEIEQLSAKPDLSDKERKRLAKRQREDEVDPEAVRKKDVEAREAYNKDINATYYGSSEFWGATAKTSGLEAGKMGFQQALGVLLSEFFSSTFSEIRDLWVNGVPVSSLSALFDDLRVRVERVARRVSSQWKSALKSFVSGSVSGFVSNVLTTLVNTFLTTSRRLIRMIREGSSSLFYAVKHLLFPPEGMTLAQSAHEASKIVFSGAVIGGGVVLEEIIEKNVVVVAPFLAPVASFLSAGISGALSAVVIAIGAYALDKFDPFGVVETERHEFVIRKLNERIKSAEGNWAL